MDPLPFHIASLPVIAEFPLPDWLTFLQQQSIRHYTKGYFTRLEEFIHQYEEKHSISAYLLWVKIRFLRMRRLYDELPPIMGQLQQLLDVLSAHQPDIAGELSFRLQQEHFLMLNAQNDKGAVEEYVLTWKAQYIPDSLFAYRIAMQHAIEEIPPSALNFFPPYYRRKYELLYWQKGKPGIKKEKALQQLVVFLQENSFAMSLREEEEWFLCVLEYRKSTRQYKEQLSAIRQFIQRRKRKFWHAPQYYLYQLYEFQSIAYEKRKEYRLAFQVLNRLAGSDFVGNKKARAQYDEIFTCLMGKYRMIKEIRRTNQQQHFLQQFNEDIKEETMRHHLDSRDLFASLDVLEQLMKNGNQEETVNWIQLFAGQIRSTLLDGKKIAPSPV